MGVEALRAEAGTRRRWRAPGAARRCAHRAARRSATPRRAPQRSTRAARRRPARSARARADLRIGQRHGPLEELRCLLTNGIAGIPSLRTKLTNVATVDGSRLSLASYSSVPTSSGTFGKPTSLRWARSSTSGWMPASTRRSNLSTHWSSMMLDELLCSAPSGRDSSAAARFERERCTRTADQRSVTPCADRRAGSSRVSGPANVGSAAATCGRRRVASAPSTTAYCAGSPLSKSSCTPSHHTREVAADARTASTTDRSVIVRSRSPNHRCVHDVRARRGEQAGVVAPVERQLQRVRRDCTTGGLRRRSPSRQVRGSRSQKTSCGPSVRR